MARSAEDEELVLRVLGPLMETMDRGDAVDEATFAAMQAVLSLMRAGDGRDLDRLRDALGSARAAVVAAGYALTTSADAERMQKSAARRT